METYNKSILDYADVRRCADFAHEQGFEKGVEKGMQQGIFYLAKKLNESGVSIELLATATGFSAEQIKNNIGAR